MLLEFCKLYILHKPSPVKLQPPVQKEYQQYFAENFP